MKTTSYSSSENFASSVILVAEKDLGNDKEVDSNKYLTKFIEGTCSGDFNIELLLKARLSDRLENLRFYKKRRE